MKDQNFKNLLQTADLNNQWARKVLTTERGLHAETLIIALARMAGSLMYRSFGLGDSIQPGTVVLSPKANIDGPKLMNLMIITLQRLGHKTLVESTIDTKYKFEGLIQLTFKETRDRLGLFCESTRQAAGMSYFDAAMATAIATAMCIHDCREVLDIRKGAGIAVHGFVEGTKTAPYPVGKESAASSSEATPQAPDQLDDKDRFFALAKAYRECVKTAFENLGLLKELKDKGGANQILPTERHAEMKRFSLEVIGAYVAKSDGDKGETYIFGEFDEKGAFYPSITEMILKIHGVANFVNAVLSKKDSITLDSLGKPLQEVLADCFFLSKTFQFYSQKVALIDGKIDNAVRNKGAIQGALNSYLESFNFDFPKVAKCCMDLDHVNEKIKRYRFLNYSWMTYNVPSDGRIVSGYFLPKEYWKPYVDHADGRGRAQS